MDTESVDIESVTADPSNVRTHDDRNIEAIAASLKRFGQQKPIVVDARGVVVAGSGTLDAARSLGWDQIAIVRTPLKGNEATAYAIADNRTAELAAWDDDGLAKVLADMKNDPSIDELVTGFDADEIAELIGGPSITLPGAEPNAEPTLASDHLIEIRCASDVLEQIDPQLQEWTKLEHCTVDIS